MINSVRAKKEVKMARVHTHSICYSYATHENHCNIIRNGRQENICQKKTMSDLHEGELSKQKQSAALREYYLCQKSHPKQSKKYKRTNSKNKTICNINSNRIIGNTASRIRNCYKKGNPLTLMKHINKRLIITLCDNELHVHMNNKQKYFNYMYPCHLFALRAVLGTHS